MSSFIAIFTGGILSGFVIYAFFHEDKWIAWENKHLIPPLRRLCARIRRSIVKTMKSNARFMKWLNKPQKHGKPDENGLSDRSEFLAMNGGKKRAAHRWRSVKRQRKDFVFIS